MYTELRILTETRARRTKIRRCTYTRIILLCFAAIHTGYEQMTVHRVCVCVFYYLFIFYYIIYLRSAGRGRRGGGVRFDVCDFSAGPTQGTAVGV